MLDDIATLIGRPYALPSDPPVTFDCWTLVKHARGMLGLPTPEIKKCTRPEHVLKEYANSSRSGEWIQLEEPKNGCIVMMGLRHEHCGVYINDCGVLHTTTFDRSPGGARVDQIIALNRCYSQLEYWELRDVS